MLKIESVPYTEPIKVFEQRCMEPYFFFLDSCKNLYGLGRWSFVGWSPTLILEGKGKKVSLIQDGEIKEFLCNPFEALRSLLLKHKRGRVKAPPFAGGAVGYVGYRMCLHIEEFSLSAEDDLLLPDLFFCFYDTLIAFDHVKKSAYIVGCKERVEKMQQMRNALKDLGGKSFSCKCTESGSSFLSSNFSKKDYIEAVGRAKEYIRKGDIYQVNLSQRLKAYCSLPAPLIYNKTRLINPAPFAAYLNCGSFTIMSFSPERFLKVRQRKVCTRPIKGTRPRGKTAEEDRILRRQLLESKKDEAELVMIVDLLRNDLGRVCKWGTVRVRHLRSIEAHPSVFHTVSTIEGVLNEGVDVVDLLYATFPGGSITGAPKIRAMQIIDELEPHARNIYTGSLGYIGFDQNADLNILIRTFILKDEFLYLHVGGGIVADSDPVAEYEETLHKGAKLVAAALGKDIRKIEFSGKRKQPSLILS